MQISFLPQKIFIEKGTEAAVTAVGIELTSIGPNEPIPLILARPLFVHHHRERNGFHIFYW